MLKPVVARDYDGIQVKSGNEAHKKYVKNKLKKRLQRNNKLFK
jgi:hypothetical protein